LKVAMLSMIVREDGRILEINRRIVSDILNQNNKIDLLVCAGWTLNTISDIAFIQKSSGNSHTTWVAEVRSGLVHDDKTAGFYVIKGKRFIKYAIKQRFAQSSDTYLGLIKTYLDFLSNERLSSVGKYNVRLIICGENNFLTNIKDNGFKAQLRFKNPQLNKVFDGILRSTDVFINSAHTPMGNMNKMRKRWELLSKNKRSCFFVTNECVKKTPKSKGRNYSANLEKRSLQYVFVNAKEKSPECIVNFEKGYKLCSITIGNAG
jgi:hypothetical protein